MKGRGLYVGMATLQQVEEIPHLLGVWSYLIFIFVSQKWANDDILK